jgi:hypothetical protein
LAFLASNAALLNIQFIPQKFTRILLQLQIILKASKIYWNFIVKTNNKAYLLGVLNWNGNLHGKLYSMSTLQSVQ